jgi:hypothetical protein
MTTMTNAASSTSALAGTLPGPIAPTPVLYHLHIPKTAGTTFYAALASRYPTDKVCPVRGDHWNLLRMPRETFAAFDLVGGHLSFGRHLSTVMGRPIRPVTMLREPRALLISLYKQVMQEPRDPIRPYVDANCPTVESFFFDPKISDWVADAQARFLSYTEPLFSLETISRIQAADPGDVLTIVREAGASPLPSPYEMLARARRRLTECEVVGLVEQFDESFARICDMMGWPRPDTPVPRKNVSTIPVSETLSPRLIARLDELSWMDRILYGEAKARFEAERGAGSRGAVRRLTSLATRFPERAKRVLTTVRDRRAA